jgi:hypothetical protein
MDDRVDVVAARPLLVNGMGRTVDPPPMRRFDIIIVKRGNLLLCTGISSVDSPV